jgi:hypothetical protein
MYKMEKKADISSLPLNLTKRPSVLDGLSLLEVVPLERIKALLKSDLLLSSWEWENYANEKLQLQAYKNLYNKSLGGVAVKYSKPKHKWGRREMRMPYAEFYGNDFLIFAISQLPFL